MGQHYMFFFPSSNNSSFREIGEGTLPWAIFRFQIVLNYSQKFERVITMYGKFCLDLY